MAREDGDGTKEDDVQDGVSVPSERQQGRGHLG